MTSPYLEQPLRSLEEVRRGKGPRNWGVPPTPEPASRKDYRLGIAVTVAVSCAGWFALFALGYAIIHLYATL